MGTRASWREIAAPIIARVLAETAGADEKTIRRALRDAYPFGERAMFPYKAWQAEVARQRGIVKMTALRRRQLAQMEILKIEAMHTSLFGEPQP